MEKMKDIKISILGTAIFRKKFFRENNIITRFITPFPKTLNDTGE